MQLPRGRQLPAALLALVLAAVDAQVDLPLANYFRRRCLHSVAVSGGHLYVHGGELSQFVEGVEDVEPAGRDSRPNNVTVSYPLGLAWDNATVAGKTVKNPGPTLKNFALWSDPATGALYSWGGEGPYGNQNGARNKTLWQFTPDGAGGGAWATKGPANPDAFLDIRRNTRGAAAVCAGKGYYLGGAAGPATDADARRLMATPGLLSYDLATGAWRNETAPDMAQTTQAGEALCAPFGGGGGVLVFVGGIYTAVDDTTAQRQLAMDRITVYNPATSEWLSQKATGEIPDQRSWHCAAGVAGPNGTYEM
jgi:hypothetical protein